MLRIKVCGVTRPQDARLAAEAGADAIGINLWPRSKRYASPDVAVAVADAIPANVARVGVFVDADPEEIADAVSRLRLNHVQLHGQESAQAVAALGEVGAFKAVRLSGPAVVDGLKRWPGPFVLVDAYLPGEPGGTGKVADWDLASAAAALRPIWLAGGLTAHNVARAVETVRPYGVDVASGVESAPGIKDAALMTAFVCAARSA